MPELSPDQVLAQQVFIPSLVKAANEAFAAKGLPPIRNEQELGQALQIADLIDRAQAKLASQTPLSKAAGDLSQLSGQVRTQPAAELSPEVIQAALSV